MSKELSLKVKRPKVDWKQVIKDIEDEELKHKVAMTFMWLLGNTNHTLNFCAYQALRHYYSSDRLEYLRWCVYGETDLIING